MTLINYFHWSKPQVW